MEMSMAVRKIKDAWWIDVRFNRVRHRLRSPENTKAGAEVYESKIRERLLRGEPLHAKNLTKPNSPTFKQFGEEWFNSYVVANNKPQEQKRKKSVLHYHLYPIFGSMNLGDISVRHVEQLKARLLERGSSPSTVNNTLNVLAKCLRCAEEWGEIQSRPEIRRVRMPPCKFDFLSGDEAGQLLQAADKPLWFAMSLMALRTGMRFGELVAIEWQDIDLSGMKLVVRRSLSGKVVTSPKNNRERSIPITKDLGSELSQLKKCSGPLFQRAEGGYITHSMARKALERTCRAAGIRRLGWHMLRHTFASHLASNSVSLQVIQQFLGHSDMKITLRYAHLAPSTLRDAIDTLERVEVRQTPYFGHLMGINSKKYLEIPSKMS